MEIKESYAVFDVNLIGDKTNTTYMGTFKVKCLISPLEEIEADRVYRELLGANSHLAQEHVRQQAFALSQLQQRVLEAPVFWENTILGGGHIQDRNVIMYILDRAIQAQEEYVEGKKKELEERQKKLAELIRSKKIKRQEEDDVPDLDKLEDDPDAPESR